MRHAAAAATLNKPKGSMEAGGEQTAAISVKTTGRGGEVLDWKVGCKHSAGHSRKMEEKIREGHSVSGAADLIV